MDFWAVVGACVALIGLLAGGIGWVNGAIARALVSHREVSDQLYARATDFATLKANMDAQKEILSDIQSMVRELQRGD